MSIAALAGGRTGAEVCCMMARLRIKGSMA
jgi:hypothetical protein